MSYSQHWLFEACFFSLTTELSLLLILLLLYIQEVFHVYLNKFENALTHLFLVILGNN